MNLIKCDPRARAKCSFADACEPEDATFLEGSVCHEFNEKVMTGEVTTRGDRFREMTDEELAEKILDGISSDPCDYCGHQNGYCDGSPCRGKAEAEIIAEWLRQPAEEDGV